MKHGRQTRQQEKQAEKNKRAELQNKAPLLSPEHNGWLERGEGDTSRCIRWDTDRTMRDTWGAVMAERREAFWAFLRCRRWSESWQVHPDQVNCGLMQHHTHWDPILMLKDNSVRNSEKCLMHQFGRRYFCFSLVEMSSIPLQRLGKTTSTHLTIAKCRGSLIIFVWLRSEVARSPPPPLPRCLCSLTPASHHQPTCSSDSQCYGQTASQWKMPEHFLGFTNTIWNKSPYQTWGLFIVLIGGKINVLCISAALFKQDKNYVRGSKAAGTEWIV